MIMGRAAVSTGQSGRNGHGLGADTDPSRKRSTRERHCPIAPTGNGAVLPEGETPCTPGSRKGFAPL
jgi:hypothetical protein